MFAQRNTVERDRQRCRIESPDSATKRVSWCMFSGLGETIQHSRPSGAWSDHPPYPQVTLMDFRVMGQEPAGPVCSGRRTLGTRALHDYAVVVRLESEPTQAIRNRTGSS